MTTPRIKNDDILAQLASGTKTIYQLAFALGVQPAVLQCRVDMLFYSGRVRIDLRCTNDLGYCLTPVESSPRAPIDTPVGERRTGPNLQSTLSGYDREFACRRELAMATRTR
ncbi:putative phage DNA-binding protein [Burkholderia pseudomallei]|nr:putative phage DNA-binding protein [Burkholderia pseudomallei]